MYGGGLLTASLLLSSLSSCSQFNSESSAKTSYATFLLDSASVAKIRAGADERIAMRRSERVEYSTGISGAEHSRAAGAENLENLIVEITLTASDGSYAQTKSLDLSGDKLSLCFEDIAVGTEVFAEGISYIKADLQKDILYKGRSESVTIKEGDNSLSLALEKVYSLSLIGVNVDFAAGNVRYEVRYLQQNITDDDYTEITADCTSSPVTKDGELPLVPLKDDKYTGFHLGSFRQFSEEDDDDIVIAVEIRYDRNIYKVSYAEGEGSDSEISLAEVEGLPPAQTARYGATITPETKGITSTPYNFTGWKNGEADCGKSFTLGAQDVTLTAQWDIKQYEVKFLNEDGTATSLNSQNVKYNYPATKDIPEKEDSFFCGWYEKDDNGNLNAEKYNFSTKIKGEKTLYAKWITSSDIQLKEKPNAVGDIVLSNGKSISYESAKDMDVEFKAIAVIFYIGTDCNNGDDSTERILGVGLSQNKMMCAAINAQAYNIKIPSIVCEPEEGGSAGNWTFPNTADRNGSDNFNQIATFLKSQSGLENDTGLTIDGEASSKNAEEAAELYPAFYFALNYKNQHGSNVVGTSYEDGWYLPSRAELFQIYKSIRATDSVVEPAIEKCNGTVFGYDEYRSSSKSNHDTYTDGYEYILKFINGTWFEANDNFSYRVCAIREFN